MKLTESQKLSKKFNSLLNKEIKKVVKLPKLKNWVGKDGVLNIVL